MIAGQIGLDPGPYTLRELLWMAEGVWVPTCEILALTANIARDPKKHGVFRASEFNPYRNVTAQYTRMSMKTLKIMLGKKVIEKTKIKKG